jgi:DNA-3-methyladenine glycosylase I
MSEQQSQLYRCTWSASSSLMKAYHDKEWGVPVHDDHKLFEMLILEAAQAGLSWQTILNKRESYRKAFSDFDPSKVARYDARHVSRLLADPGIIRNRRKIAATIQNAQALLKTQEEFGSFGAYIWRFVGGKPIDHKIRKASDVPPKSAESDAMSKDLLKRGFKFVGPTICYAFMQAVGMINDHEMRCFRHKMAKKNAR